MDLFSSFVRDIQPLPAVVPVVLSALNRLLGKKVASQMFDFLAQHKGLIAGSFLLHCVETSKLIPPHPDVVTGARAVWTPGDIDLWITTPFQTAHPFSIGFSDPHLVFYNTFGMRTVIRDKTLKRTSASAEVKVQLIHCSGAGLVDIRAIPLVAFDLSCVKGWFQVCPKTRIPQVWYHCPSLALLQDRRQFTIPVDVRARLHCLPAFYRLLDRICKYMSRGFYLDDANQNHLANWFVNFAKQRLLDSCTCRQLVTSLVHLWDTRLRLVPLPLRGLPLFSSFRIIQQQLVRAPSSSVVRYAYPSCRVLPPLQTFGQRAQELKRLGSCMYVGADYGGCQTAAQRGDRHRLLSHGGDILTQELVHHLFVMDIVQIVLQYCLPPFPTGTCQEGHQDQ